MYKSFFRNETAEGMTIERIKEILQSKERLSNLTLNINYLVEICAKVMNLITLFEGQGPLSVEVYDKLEDLRSYLIRGTDKTEFGEKTDL